MSTNKKNIPAIIRFSWLELVICVGLLLLYGTTTYQRNFIWKDDLTLWLDVVKKSPNKARPYNYLGLAYHKRGLEDEAITQFKKCISLSPLYANAHVNLGVSYYEKGLVDKAIDHFKYAILIKPGHADAHYNLGVAYGDKGMMDEAYRELLKGMKLQKR